ncbi:threonine/serine exporter family protein [Clostridium sp. MSJ-4]|uniref:Threonine/serine exporter family protein n=1 Tax=Clostridium simiarum TaxID=2841506 RepID=A0ABS6F045_9CLOT|nr:MULTISPECIES: threonine/serine exporter family protein [Clostridium]MBU5590962.1 threonine/serine exporter family protein [Clostridium simiarum]
MDVNKIIFVATEAGRIILENGGETYRVEETILRICDAYLIKNADSYVTPTGIMVSATDKYGHNISIIKRIKKRTVDLEKISQVNDLSRSIKLKGMTADEFREELKKIENAPRYSYRITILSACLIAGFFTLMFGGGFGDFIASFLIGGIIHSVSIYASKLNINAFFINILGGMLSALLAIIFVSIGISSDIDKIIIGSIMLLVPGIAITNAIRDTIAGDLVAGLARSVEAFLIAIAIAVGSGIVLSFWLLLSGGF